MTEETDVTRTVVVEREFAHPPEKVWRALTRPELMAEWLMQSDFRPETGHSFRFIADWGQIDCRVLEIDRGKTIVYSWEAHGVATLVTWTLEAAEEGTRLRMEQTGFRTDQRQAIAGARGGWAAFFDNLQNTLSDL